MPSILHISDLHRTQKPRLGNEALFAAIASDSARWEQEGIPKPELVVVSGDLIQGAGINACNPDCEIAAQYKEAEDFLQRLAEEFVDADRARVVLVPGNHDVQWSRALDAMESLDSCPSEIANQAFDSGSNVRWNWNDQKAYKVINGDLYQSRFKHFLEFQTKFYHGLEPSPLQTPNSGCFFQEYPSLGIVIGGFASWYGNDCFCLGGEIDIASIVWSRQLLKKCESPVAIAVWHHNVIGGPRAHDYMDQHTIHKLIDIGFRIGLHGHQHYSDAKPFELGLPNIASMAVIGAGSIAAGDGDLPAGEPRQFNIVNIDPDSESITVHFRAMSSGGIFTALHRNDCGGETSVKLKLPPMAPRSTDTDTKKIDDAVAAIATREYAQALYLADEIGDLFAHQKRKIKIESLRCLKKYEELIQFLDPAHSAEEAIQVIGLLMDFNRFDEALQRLKAAAPLLDHATYTELDNNVTSRKAFFRAFK